MYCPSCRAEDTRVVDSRLAQEGASVRRRRHCIACSHRFTTFERLEEAQLAIVKADGSVQPFDRTKIEFGVRSALKGRAVTDEQIAQLSVDVEDELRLGGGGEISSSRVGLAVLERLRDIDEVAYMRFASVYKNFDGAADFESELQLLKSSTAGAS